MPCHGMCVCVRTSSVSIENNEADQSAMNSWRLPASTWWTVVVLVCFDGTVNAIYQQIDYQFDEEQPVGTLVSVCVLYT